MIYKVDLERDEAGWWVATARDVPGCHTQGRSIRQALARVRLALAACIDEDARGLQVEPHVHLSVEARQAVTRCKAASERLERDQDAARLATAEAVGALVGGMSLSVRDAGEVLGLSHQRVSQLTRIRSMQR